MAVSVGDTVPNFTLPSQTGESVSIQDFRGKQPVVLYFYPKDDTPGCTAESCAFRDRYEAFTEKGAQVIGVSSDSVASHAAFAQKHNLPFLLLSDEGDRVRKLFGVPPTLWILPGRVTYVIDKDGIVRHVFNSQMNFEGHITESLETLQSLAA